MCAQEEKATAKVLGKNGRLVNIKVDRCIADLVTRLNAAGIATGSSCCGHGDDSQFFISMAPDSCFFAWRGDTDRNDLWCGLLRRINLGTDHARP